MLVPPPLPASITLPPAIAGAYVTVAEGVARLPQTAAPLLLEFPGIVDERVGAREDRASERPKALREIDPARVVKIAVVANRNSRFHRSIE